MIKTVKKRDGRVVPFDEKRITNAIFKAACSVGGRSRLRNVPDRVNGVTTSLSNTLREDLMDRPVLGDTG